ncbi:hypothetical protein AUR64_14270 [Haloprofundus marisrubri]|uniref:DUF58 domain-containing protein n=2 Tax=Haloprofundus marisrubri TaxID=1514971 RepID=A0A0W1R6E2_9EURY|nr:hypothetical protein AUR64_14270 [Haloprofundus marisrubri]
MFTETYDLSTATAVTIEPPEPHDVYVGQGGRQLASAYGEHDADKSGSGLLPYELREYVDSDSANRIDWKATARLGSPHVTEYELEAEQRTILVVDARASTKRGQPGETPLDYIREVGLGLVDSAEKTADPVSLYLLEEGQYTLTEQAAKTSAEFRRIRYQLNQLSTQSELAQKSQGQRTRVSLKRSQLRTQFSEDDSTLGQTLSPYLKTGFRTAYTNTDVLGEVVERIILEHRDAGSVQVQLLTTDLNQPTLLDSAARLSENGHQMVTFLTPAVLFDTNTQRPIAGEDSYREYVEFEEFRRTLARLDRVKALELGPRNRVKTLLAQRDP